MFVVPMQSLLDRGAMGYLVPLSIPAGILFVCLALLFPAFRAVLVVRLFTGSGCLEGSSMAEASWGGRCVVPSGRQHFLLHPKLLRTAKVLSSPITKGLRCPKAVKVLHHELLPGLILVFAFF